MRRVTVIKPGFQSTVQDTGRHHHAHLGVSASGAADAVSMRFGNLLVGNAANAPALEMTLVGGKFLFKDKALIAITGSNFEPKLDGAAVPLWTSIPVAAGQVLEFAATKSGARCYLCVCGGISVPLVLGSASTHIMTGLGGYLGRALRTGDELQLGTPRTGSELRRLPEQVVAKLARRTIRVTEAPQSDMYSNPVMTEFVSSPYLVSEESNRMGIRLLGNAVRGGPGSGQMLTEGVSLGAVQVPHGGQPIILFVEHQTTGGYPKIANVISADMHALGQLRPRDTIRFEFVSLRTAWEALTDLEQTIQPQSLVTFNA